MPKKRNIDGNQGASCFLVDELTKKEGIGGKKEDNGRNQTREPGMIKIAIFTNR